MEMKARWANYMESGNGRGKKCEEVTVSHEMKKKSGKWQVPLGGRRCLQNHDMDKRWECHMWRQRGKTGFMNIWKKGAEETTLR